MSVMEVLATTPRDFKFSDCSCGACAQARIFSTLFLYVKVVELVNINNIFDK